jgi:hypothetical protein
MPEGKEMERTSKALRLVTVEVAAIAEAIGEGAMLDSASYVRALAERGYVPVPIPWKSAPVPRHGEIDLLILGRGEAPVPPPSAPLMRAIAFMEAAFHVGRAIGEPGEAQKERIVDIADSLERLAPDERSVLGAHYHHVLRTPASRPRPLGLLDHSAVSRDRVVRSLYAAATADGTLYDVVLERLEALLDGEGVDGAATVRGLVSARQVVLRYARAEHDPARWRGLALEDGMLLSWIVARPKAVSADLEARARQLGLDARDSLTRIKSWIDADPTLGGTRAPSLPAPADQRP